MTPDDIAELRALGLTPRPPRQRGGPCTLTLDLGRGPEEMRLCARCFKRYGAPAHAALIKIDRGPVEACDHQWHDQTSERR